MDRRILCPVVDDSDIPVTVANAFQILEDVGGSFFLDFLYCCPTTRIALVVARLRLQRETLRAVRDRLLCDVVEMPASRMVH